MSTVEDSFEKPQDITSLNVSRRQARRGSATGSMTASGSSKTTYKREIAALEFLLGISMKAEREIVHQGWLQQNGIAEMKRNIKKAHDVATPMAPDVPTPMVGHQGRWWEKWVGTPPKPMDLNRSSGIDEEELEQPNQLDESNRWSKLRQMQESRQQQVVAMVHAPGRRLEGDDAIRIQIPPEIKASARQRQIARMAAKKEWELEVAHGIDNTALLSSKKSTNIRKDHPPLLDGRIFFSAAGSYPCEVFSVIRYEPKKEEAARRRKKLEARGGGGSEFIVPARDWRGISYRALLPTREQKGKHSRSSNDNSIMMFDRFQNHDPSNNNNNNNNDKSMSGATVAPTGSETHGEDDESDEEPDTYVPGLLDDPAMVLGRHRNVMIGDRSTGCIVTSTIQFVQPTLLKSNLNMQFRERFDGWEPPKVQRPFIGAKIVDGVYTLMEDADGHGSSQNNEHQGGPNGSSSGPGQRKRQGSVTSVSQTDASEIIRMPPSLTLSKIRSLKQQALRAAVKARLEISTVALAIVYFERLCLDCRIDKTNRRMSFAACLLLALKINESHVGLASTQQEAKGDNSKPASKTLATNRIQSLYRSTKKSNNMFSALLEFFTQEWEISLKNLFSAEWGVFAALQFRLHAKPSQVAFHFKRLLKSLDRDPRRYLGGEMFSFWQTALTHEEYLRQERQVRMEIRQEEKEKLMQMQREMGRLETIDGVEERANAKAVDREPEKEKAEPSKTNSLGPPKSQSRLGLSILHRFGHHGTTKRSLSTDTIPKRDESPIENDNPIPPKLTPSASLPLLSSLLPNGNLESTATNLFSNTDHNASSVQQERSERGADDARSISDHSETSIIMI